MANPFERPIPTDWHPTRGEQVWVKTAYGVLEARTVQSFSSLAALEVAWRHEVLVHPEGWNRTLWIPLENLRPLEEKP